MPEEKSNILIVDQERFSCLITKMLSSRYVADTDTDGPSGMEEVGNLVIAAQVFERLGN